MRHWVLIVTLVVVVLCVPTFVWLILRINQRTDLTKCYDYLSKLQTYITADKEQFKGIPIYYINLDRSPIRKERIEKHLAKYGVKSTRISAIDGKNAQCGEMDGVSYHCEFLLMKQAEIACTLSHLKAIRRAYNDGHEYALILEDDVTFELVPFWQKNALQNIIMKVPSTTGIIQLSWNGGNAQCDYSDELTIQHNPTNKYCYSAAAYIITRKGMKDIIDHAMHPGNSTYYIRRHPVTHMPTNGIADVYLYQITPTVNTALPLLFPNNLDDGTSTTITGRMYNANANVLRYFKQVLRLYYEKYIIN